ncbi:hypothetical protein LENED_004709 [Lentinula edodes]|uniref:Uncharacterized protein n=1 Tax=Lentinula edodes TaxID=5353 RepID=A0A1Q3E764_LENED|nr:hypothetical protein LENED_004709 [Lentinula edodes]
MGVFHQLLRLRPYSTEVIQSVRRVAFCTAQADISRKQAYGLSPTLTVFNGLHCSMRIYYSFLLVLAQLNQSILTLLALR